MELIIPQLNYFPKEAGCFNGKQMVKYCRKSDRDRKFVTQLSNLTLYKPCVVYFDLNIMNTKSYSQNEMNSKVLLRVWATVS